MTARVRRFVAAHDVVGSAGRLALGTAFAAFVLLGLTGLAPRGSSMLSTMSALAVVLGVVAAMSGLISLLARHERDDAMGEMVGEIEEFLRSQPPANHR
ncbi:hypothetical protein ATJ97_2369 [Georgenia soli]|uniref:Uncharacterized protein n=1 Tax=Georgenia soli TaxID=638953 RepID=A0A2A9EMV4_9MICO|nr:hypothetical protein [Georgenia soli]PFG39851.1 hypothetical protein ATJ97_2369 [Georgenia soli]